MKVTEIIYFWISIPIKKTEEKEEESVTVETTQKVKKVKFADMVKDESETISDNISETPYSEFFASSDEQKVPKEYEEVC